MVWRQRGDHLSAKLPSPFSQSTPRLQSGPHVGDALYSPLLFLCVRTETQSEGGRKRGGTHAQGEEKKKKKKKGGNKTNKQRFTGRDIYKISGTSVNFEPC